LWLQIELSDLPQLGVGSLLGAFTAIAVLRNRRSRLLLFPFNVAMGIAVGAIVAISLRWPQTTLLVVVGFLASAAPMTLAISPAPLVTSSIDARRYLRRRIRAVASYVVYGIASGIVGFIAAYGLSIALFGDVI
jgi:riboflavin transporter FmnP